MHLYRSHNCGELRNSHAGQTVKLSGWIHRIRDHGGVLFIDLRDTYGLIQCVVDVGSPVLAQAAQWRAESVITITGEVRERIGETKNSRLSTGDIEIYINEAVLQSGADVLPLQVAEPDGAGEDLRLKYRFLDLRREGMHSRIRLRNNVISSMRRRMWDRGFQEFNTPILTASSPEGARDYLVPSRIHAGKFYALPQAPQQFKQLLMVSGFDRYFQIAPCFRDEDGRADRLAEFYQLDVEMSFVQQEDIFEIMTGVIGGIFEEFAGWTGTENKVVWLPNMRYDDAILRYGSDKPDLRNPLEIVDVTDVFKRDDVTFNAFKGVIEKGGVVRAIRAPKVSDLPRSFFDKLNDWARGEGAPGLGYVLFADGEGKGPIAKFIPAEAQVELKKIASIEEGDAIFFVCDKPEKAAKFAGRARDRICDDLPEGHSYSREKGVYKLFWIVDFPMYEADEKTGKIDFSHNPFSMPQGGLDALNGQDPLTVLATQYDCVCNGFELASGGIRNHRPDIMEKAFAIAGYDKEVLEKKFGGMLNAFRFGAPPHGGCAFGIDRIVMLLANEPNLREVYAFVMNGAYEDQMMGAPSPVVAEQLKDLHIRVVEPIKAAEKKSA
ncbi:MAG: aspartate--tRNA ligase [Micavibrio aeruginosavorus]|uniref:Aspartate--tRNA(Asp/Asn) ligase n=1 Tax=Micavibrio aeruginosavorus TaxID=349221 RepID=A0A2W5FPW5_9BACT|nr:MAG: aspartate--tRNA ligase [Micavibrio aeruginosavorus]